MNTKQFIEKYNGKGVDYDKSFGFQCCDLFNQYLFDVLKIQDPIKMFPVVSAFQIYDYAMRNKDWEVIANDPYAVPKSGDIIVWKKTKSLPHGHVGIFVSGDVMKLKSFDQNWPIGSLSKIVDHNYDGVLGWIRYKKDVVMPDLELTGLINKIKEALSKFDGHKTYIIVAVIVGTVVLYNTGYIDERTFNLLDTLFLAFLGFSLRDAIRKK